MSTLTPISSASPTLPGISIPAPIPGGTDLNAHRDFERVLGIARRTPRAHPDATPAEHARVERARLRESTKAAEQLVAAAMVEPMLKSVRTSTWAAEPFKPTQAESQLRTLMDQRVAQEIVHASRLPIVDRLARQMLERSGPAAPATTVVNTAA
jgi:Rod binding domain-containing protein